MVKKEKIIKCLKSDVKKFNRWKRLYKIEKLDLSYADLSYADLSSAVLNSANLRSANLRSAVLNSADLISANLDFSQIDLSCKSLKAKFDDKQTIQILYHAVKQAYNQDFKNIKNKELISFLRDEKTIRIVNMFHKVEECGKI